MTKNILLAFFIALSVILGALLYFESKMEPASIEDQVTTDESIQFPFLSKRIFAENQNDILINFTPLRMALRSYLKKQAAPLGVYFEYLPSGISIGVNDTLEVNLASLLKVPVAMAIYKQIEKGTLKKDTVLVIKKEYLDNRFGNEWKKGEGNKLTIENALELALMKSDNTASNALLHALPAGAIDDVFDSLDIPKDTKGQFHVISPKSYSSILRSLYLSSYLEHESSHEILTYLTKTDFKDQIPAGVPVNIDVAHKIGVFDLKNEEKTYSDCGIIYYPNRPYILCIMSNGSEESSREHMKTISRIVYSYISLVK